MVTLKYDGRLGNNLIQYISSLFFAKKFNLNFNLEPNSNSGNWNFLLKNRIVNGLTGNQTIEVNDDNFIDLLNREKIEPNHYHFNGYFQNKEFLQTYESEIKSLLNINYINTDKDSVFVHYRIGDVMNDRRMLPLEYYIDALDSITFKSGFISSDSIDHVFCKQLISKYNLTPIHGLSPIDTLNFGKNFNNLVLSEGTFSWWIGYLSNAENIICNKRNYLWHGDIFLDRWKKLQWDYDESVIYDSRKLKEYKIKKIT
jgi:hypothetical protein